MYLREKRVEEISQDEKENIKQEERRKILKELRKEKLANGFFLFFILILNFFRCYSKMSINFVNY